MQERSRDGSSFAADDWDDRPRTIEEIQAMLQTRKDAALKRERALSYAFSHQVRHDFLFFRIRAVFPSAGARLAGRY